MSSNPRILASELDSYMQSVKNSSLEGKKVSSMTHKKENKKEGLQAVITKKK